MHDCLTLHGVLLLGPTDEVVAPGTLAGLGLTVIQYRSTADLGPCAVQGCSGHVHQLSVPVLDNPNDVRPDAPTTLHHRRACLNCGCPVALPQIAAPQAA